MTFTAEMADLAAAVAGAAGLSVTLTYRRLAIGSAMNTATGQRNSTYTDTAGVNAVEENEQESETEAGGGQRVHRREKVFHIEAAALPGVEPKRGDLIVRSGETFEVVEATEGLAGAMRRLITRRSA